ncbi:hypothetical protein M427DRAFT_469276 [Gonapodya prolifera JEL478]|uniref:Ribosomal protein 60S n=1 Tax=Gonapodya prolifera (strain JEL478) TaxID=1344416 RepID=A0A139AQU1_GONPJ|nr:hypothetical protein M427DRAFT_469276 [Gonapodya prolifera JEL478]|eukprot:KXS19121.1 hypothetical protein M427DRAFT_469276 [Gonapodya prolifera JEL478]
MAAEFGPNEQACAYAALILVDEGLPVTADKIIKLVEAAGIEMEGIWAKLFAKALEGRDLAAHFTNFSEAPTASVSVAAPVAAAPAADAPADDKKGGKKEEKKKEEKKEEEEDDDMGFGLFD